MDPASTPRLLRAVGLLGLSAIAINGVIGSGIFALPATVFGLIGAASPIAYLLVAVLMALVVACFAEAGSRFDETGGPYLYARAAFGDFVGFQVGWMFLLSRLASTAAISNAFANYLGYLVPSLGGGAARIACITAALAALAALNATGVRRGARAVNIFGVAKVAPLLVLVAAGLFAIDPDRVELTALPATDSLRQAALLLVFAYGGFENACIPAEEALDPRRHLPIALLFTIAAITILYVSIQVVVQSTVADPSATGAPLAAAGQALFGPAGATMIAVAAVVATFGGLSALVLVGPRILYAFARHGRLPAGLAHIHARHLTPNRAIALFVLLAWIAALSGGFAQLALMSAMARLVFSASTCLAVLVLRRRGPAHEAGFTVPGGALMPLVAVGLSVWLLAGMTASQAALGGIALLSGMAVYAATAALSRR